MTAMILSWPRYRQAKDGLLWFHPREIPDVVLHTRMWLLVAKSVIQSIWHSSSLSACRVPINYTQRDCLVKISTLNRCGVRDVNSKKFIYSIQSLQKSSFLALRLSWFSITPPFSMERGLVNGDSPYILLVRLTKRFKTKFTTDNIESFSARGIQTRFLRMAALTSERLLHY